MIITGFLSVQDEAESSQADRAEVLAAKQQLAQSYAELGGTNLTISKLPLPSRLFQKVSHMKVDPSQPHTLRPRVMTHQTLMV